MIHETTLKEIETSVNQGVEYEIALFYKLLLAKQDKSEADLILESINKRADAEKIMSIAQQTDTSIILNELASINMAYVDVSFETQNDSIGPSDLVMDAKMNGFTFKYGLSVKYKNKNIFNPSARHFLTDEQIAELSRLQQSYTSEYITEMKEKYGDARNWFRKRKTSDAQSNYIDLIRTKVIENWPNIDKAKLFDVLTHKKSEFTLWVVNYDDNGYALQTVPDTIPEDRTKDVEARKYQSSYVGFYLDGLMFSKVQVKANNGILESVFNSKGERCVQTPSFIEDGIEMVYGKYFGSWDFTFERRKEVPEFTIAIYDDYYELNLYNDYVIIQFTPDGRDIFKKPFSRRVSRPQRRTLWDYENPGFEDVMDFDEMRTSYFVTEYKYFPYDITCHTDEARKLCKELIEFIRENYPGSRLPNPESLLLGSNEIVNIHIADY